MALQKHLKMGTRRSLLAVAQSSWVAREIEDLNPEIKIELVGIDTRGDKILDVALQKVEGKDFFVVELDNALLDVRVDFTVHSMKDLSLDRPEGLQLACVPKRENSRDLVIFSTHAIENLKKNVPLKIGTSSPRRLETLPTFLSKALPIVLGNIPRLNFLEIRGNVNTRLSRLHESLDSEKYLDGVVLAVAGLNRLLLDRSGEVELRKLLVDTRLMLLPLKECPTAPGQGALAVECRKNDQKTFDVLRKLHDSKTLELVLKERERFRSYGGGCHQRFGVSAFEVFSHESKDVLELFSVKGKKPDGGTCDSFEWNAPPVPQLENTNIWDGMSAYPSGQEANSIKGFDVNLFKEKTVFFTHSKAYYSDFPKQNTLDGSTRVWASGTTSWFKLAKQGIWVEGSAEGFGFDYLKETLPRNLFLLPEYSDWIALTHLGALPEWTETQAIATYESNSQNEYSELDLNALKKARHIFWGSGSQFMKLRGHVLQTARHYSGPGKTYKILKREGVDSKVFPSVEEWRKWIGI